MKKDVEYEKMKNEKKQKKAFQPYDLFKNDFMPTATERCITTFFTDSSGTMVGLSASFHLACCRACATLEFVQNRHTRDGPNAAGELRVEPNLTHLATVPDVEHDKVFRGTCSTTERRAVDASRIRGTSVQWSEQEAEIVARFIGSRSAVGTRRSPFFVKVRQWKRVFAQARTGTSNSCSMALQPMH